ncbi:MAG: hypothetical protein FJ149_03835 [Euryarchaeota archaeon]|nr:hypothetical protein [Euryarchaeota archaeon]
MALIDFIYAAYIGVIVTILIGIFVEGRRAQLDNVLSNMSSFFILLATATMPVELVVALLVYLSLGILMVYLKKKDFYLLFGSKTYGSVSLVILFAENQFFGFIPYFSFGDLRSMVLGCVVVAMIVHVIGFLYTHRRRGFGSRRRTRRSKATSERRSGRRRRR